MRRPTAWLLGAFAAAGFLRRRQHQHVAHEEETEPDPRAEEREEFEAAETTVDQAYAPDDPETRRRAVHEAGRAAAERMRER